MKKLKNLSLSKQTLRALTEPMLRGAAGGYCTYVTDLQGGTTCGRSRCQRPFPK